MQNTAGKKRLFDGFKEKTPRLECLNIESKSTISSSDVNDFRKATKHMPVGICFYKAPDECIDGIALYPISASTMGCYTS